MTKYAKLTSLLESLGTSSRRMAFAEIENILEFSLPPSARRYPEWWGNNPIEGRQSMAWLSAGWQAEEIDLPGETVTFRRGAAVPKTVPSKATGSGGRARKPVEEAKLDDLPDAPDGTIAVAIAMQWKQLGAVGLDDAGKLTFPAAPMVPALYRLRLIGPEGTRHYIGETVNLRRRLGNYRNPGPTQATSIRINEVLRTHLAADGQAEVDLIASDIELSIGGQSLSFDLADKAVRRLLEQAALVANHAIDIESLNR